MTGFSLWKKNNVSMWKTSGKSHKEMKSLQIHSNSKRENDKRNMKQAWVTITKGKRTEIGKAPDWKKKEKKENV